MHSQLSRKPRLIGALGRRTRALLTIQSSLVSIDHTAVKIPVRAKIRLFTKDLSSETQITSRLDYSLFRPFTPRFGPNIHVQFAVAVEEHLTMNGERHVCES